MIDEEKPAPAVITSFLEKGVLVDLYPTETHDRLPLSLIGIRMQDDVFSVARALTLLNIIEQLPRWKREAGTLAVLLLGSKVNSARGREPESRVPL